MRNNYADTAAMPLIIKKHDAAANADATATLAADSAQFWVVDEITWSYSAAPTGGRLTVTLGSTVIVDIDITAGGPGVIAYEKPRYTGTKNEILSITLAAGGSGITGKVSARTR